MTSRVIGTYRHLLDFLLKEACQENFSTEFHFVVEFYGNDFHPSLLKAQLDLLGTSFSELGEAHPTLPEIKDYFKRLSLAARSGMSKVCTLLKIILVMPATNSVSERSASALRRIKTYLRTTMGQNRLNNLMCLHVHLDRTDDLSLQGCLNYFVRGSEHRLTMFGSCWFCFIVQ